MIKWVAAFIGFSYFRFYGAILGFFIGQLLENVFFKSSFKGQNNFAYSTRSKMQVDLLTLAAIVIKADGKVDPKELEYVRHFFISHYASFKNHKFLRH